MSEHATGAAACARHPAAAAISVCDRCGAFLCDACSEGGTRRLCPTCRARVSGTAFPLRRDDWSLDGLFRAAWRAFTGSGLQLGVGLLIFMGVYLALSVLPLFVGPVGPRDRLVHLGIFLVGSMLELVLVMSLWLGLLDMTFDALDGRPVRLGTLFWQFGKTGKLLMLLLVTLGAVLLPTLAFKELAVLAVFLGTHLGVPRQIDLGVLAGGGLLALAGSVWLLLAVSLAQLELALDDDVGAVGALRRGFRLARGKRWALLGVGLLAGLVGMAGLLLCGVGVLASLPLASLLTSGLFLALRQGSGLPAPVRRGRRARREEAPVAATPPAAAGT